MAKRRGLPGPEPAGDDSFEPKKNRFGAGATSSGISRKTEEDQAKSIADKEQELDDEITNNFRMAYDAEREWIDEAKEDIEFKAGKQWTDEEKATLELQRRPCLTFNKIKPIVKLITGHLLQNTNRIQVSPEGGEDQKFSSIADRLLDHIDTQANLDFNLGYAFAGGETTGRSFVELNIDYQNDPIFGTLKSIYHGKPGIIIPDPRGISYDLNEDRQFCFKLAKKTKSELKELYPDKATEIDEITMDSENPQIATAKEGDANNYGRDKKRSSIGIHKSPMEDVKGTKQQFHVLEYWRYKLVDKWCVYFVHDGSMPKFDTEELANADIEQRKAKYLEAGGIPEKWKTLLKKRKTREMNVAIRAGGKILADDKSPFEPHYSGFPFFQFIADWTPESEDLVMSMQGIVRTLKDPQREVNKSRSQFLHIISTAANSGWIIDKGAMDQTEKEELKKFGSMPGIVIQKNDNKTVQRIEPVPAPVAQQVREKAASDDFKSTSGVNSDLLSIDQSSNPSGKAIALRIRQAITILEPDFRNFRYTKRLMGTAIVQMMPTLFDVPKAKKVLGENYMKQEEVDDVYLKTFLFLIEDLKYNVKVAEQGDTKTMREETFEDLMQMIQSGNQIPFEVLSDFMNLPNKTEVVKKVKEYQAAQMAHAAAIAGAKSGASGASAPPLAPPPQ